MAEGPIRVTATGAISAPAAAVWATVADFGSVAAYLPSVVECRLEGSGVGCRRVLTTADGGRVVSELIELDDAGLVMGYRIVEGSLPFEEYTSRVRVRAVADDRCEVTWSSEFRPDVTAAGDSGVDVASWLQAQLESGVEGLRRLHEGGSAPVDRLSRVPRPGPGPVRVQRHPGRARSYPVAPGAA